MIRKLKIWENEFSVGRAAAIVGILTFATKLSALLRERLLASTFGQGQVSDAYFSAFRIPDFVTNLFVLSTLSIAFLPVFARERNKSPEEANKFASVTLNIALVFIVIVCLGLLMFSSPLTRYLVPGFSGEQYENTLKLTRLFLITPVIFACSTIFGGILNARKKFLVTSFAPILYNFGIIGGVAYLYPRFGIMGLGYGVVLGAVAQLLVQIANANFKWEWNFNFRLESFKHMLRLYLPRILTFDLANVTLLFATVLASVGFTGSITAINQSFNLQSVPIGIFAYALASAVFPVLAEAYAEKNEQAFLRSLQNTIRQILYIMLPFSAFMIIFRAFVVRILLGSGNFTWENTITTFTFLGIFSISLVSQSLTTLFSRAFYARHNTKVPVMANLWSIACNVIVSYFLFQKYQVEGLVIGFVLASFFNAAFLLIKLRAQLKREIGKEQILAASSSIFNSLVKILFATLLATVTAYVVIYLAAPFFDTDTFLGILFQSAIAATAGVAIYWQITYKFRLPEASLAIRPFKKIFDHFLRN